MTKTNRERADDFDFGLMIFGVVGSLLIIATTVVNLLSLAR